MRQWHGEPLREHGRYLRRKIRRRQQILRRVLGLLPSTLPLRPEDPRQHPVRRSSAHALRRHHGLRALEEERMRAREESGHSRRGWIRPLWHPLRQGKLTTSLNRHNQEGG